MDNRVKYEYLSAKGGDNKFLKCELYYDLGGYSMFTHEERPRGYYVSVMPVEKNGIMESYAMFSGFKMLVVECKRKSKKAEEQAKALYENAKNEIIRARFADVIESEV